MEMKKAGSGSGRNNSHRTRFSRDNQPKRRRGPAKKRANANILRMMADVLGEPMPVGRANGKTVSMPCAMALVTSIRNEALKGGLNDKLRLWDRLAKYGLLDDLKLQEMRELEQMLEDERQSNQNAKVLHDALVNVWQGYFAEALELLIYAESLLAKIPPEYLEEATALRRRIVGMQLEHEARQRSNAPSASPGWHIQSEEDWIEAWRRREAEDEKIRIERLARFDRENPMPRSADPDDDDPVPA